MLRSLAATPSRAQIGVLQFGTELVASKDGSMCGLLGASPGASISVQVGLDVLQSCFASKIDGWAPKLKEMIPSYGEKLNGDAAKARANMAFTAKVLQLWGAPEAVNGELEVSAGSVGAELW